jgi:hypothetical protein
VSPRRGDRVTIPPRPDQWEVRFGTSDAATGWEELCRPALANARRCLESLRTDPRSGAVASATRSKTNAAPYGSSAHRRATQRTQTADLSAVRGRITTLPPARSPLRHGTSSPVNAGWALFALTAVDRNCQWAGTGTLCPLWLGTQG